MFLARQIVLFVLVASIGASVLWARSSSQASPAIATAVGADLSSQRAFIADSKTALEAGDYATARAKALEAVTSLLARTATEQGAAWLALLDSAGSAAYDAQDARTANAAWKRVYDVRSAVLPEDHPDLLLARANFAETLYMLGDLAGARDLFEKSLAVLARTLPEDDPDLQTVRGNLAAMRYMLGDLAGARALQEQVLAVGLRTLPAEHESLQTARLNLGSTLQALGDLAGARALQEAVLAVYSRTLPEDHTDLQVARLNLAATMQAQGDLVGARALQEKAIEVFSRTLPEDHPDLQLARGNLAGTIHALGDLAGARALAEKVLEIRSRTLPEDHPDLQKARMNLASTLSAQGDFVGARALQEKALEVSSRILPQDHPDLQMERMNLAVTLQAAGDLVGARALQEKVLEVNSRTLPPDHPYLQVARMHLASTILALGDIAGARALQEQALEVFSRTFPEDHLNLQLARQYLAMTLAREVARERRSAAGEGEMTRSERERCAELIGGLCRAHVRAARAAILESPGREAEERCSRLADALDVSISFAEGYGVFEPLSELARDSFVFAETTRGAALVSAELTRRAASAPKYRELRDALRKASDALAALAQKGMTSAEFDRARVKRESVERDLVALAREIMGADQGGVELDVEGLAARLEKRGAAVGFRRFTKKSLRVAAEVDATGLPTVRETAIESLCAFVVRGPDIPAQSDVPVSRTLTLVDLGPIAPIEEVVRAWRDDLGVGSDSRGLAVLARDESTARVHAQGVALREKILDPLLPALAGAQRIVIALDDVLHLVPLDALPFDGSSLVGDRWQIETRTTLTELLLSSDPPKVSGELVAFGDVEYASREPAEKANETGAAVQVAETDHRPSTLERAGILRGSAWSEGFSALPATGVEVRGIARCFSDQCGDGAVPKVCLSTSATRERLLELATEARYLHIATHGWFAPESIQSWSDPEPLDKQSGLGMRMSGAEQVKGMSPMLLCGLALAGANLPETAMGRVPGLVTADELSTLDLSNCELVVLSACDTNVGERRAGQGVASLQKALQMAGARSVITSLWKVPDEATKELMLDFYRRLWVEKKPKHQALWEAKTKLREAKDASGAPKYTTRDWAAWVLTGNPD